MYEAAVVVGSVVDVEAVVLLVPSCRCKCVVVSLRRGVVVN